MEDAGRKQVTASPCAACKLLRRRCAQDCVFAPYFPADEQQKFAIVHKVFGASNVSKLLQELEVQHRSDAVSSLVYEANARARDPVYGCVGTISSLQSQIQSLQAQLAVTQAKMVHLNMSHTAHLAHIGIHPSPAETDSSNSSSSSGSSSMSFPKCNQLMGPPCDRRSQVALGDGYGASRSNQLWEATSFDILVPPRTTSLLFSSDNYGSFQ